MYIRNEVVRFGAGARAQSDELDASRSGASFVQQYFTALASSPAALGVLYRDTSTFQMEGRPHTGSAAIMAALATLPAGPSLATMDVQPISADGAVLLCLVTGSVVLEGQTNPLAMSQILVVQSAPGGPPAITNQAWRLNYS